MMPLNQENISPGLTSLNIEGKTLKATVGGKEVKIYLADNAVKVWVDGVRYTRDGIPETKIHTAPIKYPDNQFREVNWIVEHKHYSKEAAIGDTADKYGHDKDNFRRQYYARKGSLMGMEEPK